MSIASCFTQDKNEKKIPIQIVTLSEWEKIFGTTAALSSGRRKATRSEDRKLGGLTEIQRNWINAQALKPAEDVFYLLPNEQGQLNKVIYITKVNEMPWSFGSLYNVLPSRSYEIETSFDQEHYFLVWGLQAYRFDRYLTIKREANQPRLFRAKKNQFLDHLLEAIYLVRDLINTPTEDLCPGDLIRIAQKIAKRFKAQSTIFKGDQLLSKGYPMVHMVGRASTRLPCVIDFKWGNPKHPKVTLIGKGVCFDSGGLNIKVGKGMLLMKKDMGGAAHVLALAQLIMQQQLPIRLRVIIPAVENMISGNAYRPGDVVKTRKGMTVEIANTDAEGRLILADALAAASEENPELIIDFATLTGAARVALGTELPALFSNDLDEVNLLLKASQKNYDPLWHMPLHQPYRSLLNSTIADINHVGDDSYGGAILAALFLKEFVNSSIKWHHIDLMAWNLRARPGRPDGGEAMGLRAVFEYLRQRFERQH